MATPAQLLESDRHKYPGMAPREVLVWRKWLEAHQSEYSGWEYNVLLGNGIDPGPMYPQVYRDQYIRNTQKRADAVAHKGITPYIFEVKARAVASSMSQLLTYKALWPVTFPKEPAPVLVLVSDRVAADMPMVLAASGIRFDQVDGVDYSILTLNQAAKETTPRG